MSSPDQSMQLGARRHVSIHFEGGAAETIDALRSVWDPVMMAIAPPHVTVVYPEETVDEHLLLDRLAVIAGSTEPFPLHIGEIICSEEGRGGVFAPVDDPTGRLETIRDQLLLPPQRFSGYPFHVTIAHPRTASDPAACWQALRDHRLDLDVVAGQALFTTTDATGRTVMGRYPFAGRGNPSRTSMAGGLLLSDGRVLLGLRHRSRANQPGVWDMPGGHVEPGESPRRALRRELREELGIDAVLEGAWRHLVDDDLGVELDVWLVRAWSGTLTNAAELEHERLAWFTRAELSALPFPHPAYPELLAGALRTPEIA